MGVKIERKGMLFIISGPSGAGKGTLAKWLISHDPSFRFSCSVTTREPRSNEIEGVHYYFISDDEYDRMLDSNEFLEHATVHGHRYGTPRKPVEKMLSEGINVLLDIDTQGAFSVMETAEDYVSVFITPPSYTMLRERLHSRNTDDPVEIDRRVRNAYAEMQKIDRYQYAIVNDDLELAQAQLMSIVAAEKQRVIRFHPIIAEQ